MRLFVVSKGTVTINESVNAAYDNIGEEEKKAVRLYEDDDQINLVSIASNANLCGRPSYGTYWYQFIKWLGGEKCWYCKRQYAEVRKYFRNEAGVLFKQKNGNYCANCGAKKPVYYGY